MSDETSPKTATVSIKGRIAGCDVSVSMMAAETDFKERLIAILKQLQEIGLEQMPPASPPGRTGTTEAGGGDGPLARIAREVNISEGEIRRVLGVKGESIQLYRASQYALSDAMCVICFAYEKGLEQTTMSYETFASLLAANHVKMKTPLSTVCFNLIRDGNIDKKTYDDGRAIVLTPAGEEKAARAIAAGASGAIPAKKPARTRSPKRAKPRRAKR